MYRDLYQKIVAQSLEPQVQAAAVEYLAERLHGLLRRRERVLICFQEHRRGNLSWLMEQAVLRCGAFPVVWGPDHRWKTLLRLAFTTKATTIIGEPLIALGLTKLMRHCCTPLYVRRFISAGYPCLDWMADGIRRGFDCEMELCLSLGITGAVAGFSCGKCWGVHLREEAYGVDIVDGAENPVPPGELGEVVLYPKACPEWRFPTGENARFLPGQCPCGNPAPRLGDFCPGKTEDEDLRPLGEELQRWTSILDCRLHKGESGLEMELVIFPGEKLPQLPMAAKRVIHPFEPEVDEPYWYIPVMRLLKDPS